MNLQKISGLARRRAECDYGCDKCLIKQGCKKGCMAGAVNISGEYDGNDGECDFRKLQFLEYDLKKLIANNK